MTHVGTNSIRPLPQLDTVDECYWATLARPYHKKIRQPHLGTNSICPLPQLDTLDECYWATLARPYHKKSDNHIMSVKVKNSKLLLQSFAGKLRELSCKNIK